MRLLISSWRHYCEWKVSGAASANSIFRCVSRRMLFLARSKARLNNLPYGCAWRITAYFYEPKAFDSRRENMKSAGANTDVSLENYGMKKKAEDVPSNSTVPFC